MIITLKQFLKSGEGLWVRISLWNGETKRRKEDTDLSSGFINISSTFLDNWCTWSSTLARLFINFAMHAFELGQSPKTHGVASSFRVLMSGHLFLNQSAIRARDTNTAGLFHESWDSPISSAGILISFWRWPSRKCLLMELYSQGLAFDLLQRFCIMSGWRRTLFAPVG